MQLWSTWGPHMGRATLGGAMPWPSFTSWSTFLVFFLLSFFLWFLAPQASLISFLSWLWIWIWILKNLQTLKRKKFLKLCNKCGPHLGRPSTLEFTPKVVDPQGGSFHQFFFSFILLSISSFSGPQNPYTKIKNKQRIIFHARKE